ncbi:MAG: GMC family oxidoreductase N-terminal domain-containing protein [Oceanospirillaceae bacterium]|nr:GMC family oxidoreductase N-terminal domain-containing protein [Oceanospirillaceae bacterium]
MSKIYDYIVVGGGSAGAVVAAKLVADGDKSVLLLEAGHSHKHPLVSMPAGIFKMIQGSKYMHYHHCLPQPHLAGRSLSIPQGNVLGGGSSVNAQVYMRGRKADYDEWNEMIGADANWSWDDVLPCFKAMEGNNRLADQYHGINGPVLVSDPKHINDASRCFVQSMQQLGVPFNHDFNGQSQTGVGFYQFTNRDGKRSSTATAYLEPLKHNRQLTVILKAKVQKIIIEDSTATGVLYINECGENIQVCCGEEVIVAAGALITPQLLMLSGLGNKQHLTSHGIECKVDLPGVGENLIDHPEVPIIATAKLGFGYYQQGEGWRMWRNGLQFLLFGTGPIVSAGVEAGAFINPHNTQEAPTIQAFCIPAIYLEQGSKHLVEDTNGMTITTVVVKPKSRGYVRLTSANANDMPLVCPNLLQDEDDLQEMVAGQRFFIHAFSSEPLKQHIKQIVLPNINDISDETLTEHCLKTVKTNYHPAGTCRMGTDEDVMAVLNKNMQVRSVAGLRVCDMSAVPNINAGNTNAVAMMLGYRCAEFILDNQHYSRA